MTSFVCALYGDPTTRPLGEMRCRARFPLPVVSDDTLRAVLRHRIGPGILGGGPKGRLGCERYLIIEAGILADAPARTYGVA